MDVLAGQTNWAGGIVQSTARDRIPDNGAFDIYDGLLDDDGDVYLRGGVSRYTTGAQGQLGTALVALWEAQFSAGRRMLVVANTKLGVVDPAGGPGWVQLGNAAPLSGGGLSAQIGEMMFFPYVVGGLPIIGVYAGSMKASNYTIGTASATLGSKTVTGAGTSWTGAGDPGELFAIGTDIAVVKQVNSNTSLTLVDPWQGPTVAGSTYNLTPFTALVSGSPAVAAVGGRLLYADGRKVRMSRTVDPDTGQPRLFGGVAYDDYHEMPADVIAMAVLRDRVFVFHKAGIHVISGVGLEMVDAFGNAQQAVEKVSGDVVLRAPAGLAPWRDGLVVAAVDGVYVMDASGSLDPVSRAITPMWQGFSSQGAALGQMCTFRDHVFIPVPGAGGGAQPTVLVGRLDRRVDTPAGPSAPWTRFVQGRAQAIQALAVKDPGGTARLLAGTSLSGYLLDATNVFQPYAQDGVDAVDEGAFPYYLLVMGREFVLGQTRTLVRDAVVSYDMGELATPGTAQLGCSWQTETTSAVPVSLGRANHAGAGPSQRVFGAAASGRRVSFQVQMNGAPGSRLRSVALRGRKRGGR
jgi:hypothetical protein